MCWDTADRESGTNRLSSCWLILTAALFGAHVLLPARRTRFSNIWPGVLLTLTILTFLAAGSSFYLRSFAGYASYYAGLAGIIASL
jgi:membrane protein